MTEPPARTSERWGSTTKLVVALTLVAMVAALLVQFRYVLGPFFIAFVLAYLFQPVAEVIQRTLDGIRRQQHRAKNCLLSLHVMRRHPVIALRPHTNVHHINHTRELSLDRCAACRRSDR